MKTLCSMAVLLVAGCASLPAARAKLDQVAIALKQSEPDTQFVVEGYTDSRGGLPLNQELSTRRAATVRDYLVSQGGVAADRITSKGLGPSNPVADNETAEGRANNRRVEIIVQTAQNRSSQGTPSGSQTTQGTPASGTQNTGATPSAPSRSNSAPSR